MKDFCGRHEIAQVVYRFWKRGYRLTGKRHEPERKKLLEALVSLAKQVPGYLGAYMGWCIDTQRLFC
jgi:hypothetical protein